MVLLDSHTIHDAEEAKDTQQVVDYRGRRGNEKAAVRLQSPCAGIRDNGLLCLRNVLKYGQHGNHIKRRGLREVVGKHPSDDRHVLRLALRCVGIDANIVANPWYQARQHSVGAAYIQHPCAFGHIRSSHPYAPPLKPAIYSVHSLTGRRSLSPSTLRKRLEKTT